MTAGGKTGLPFGNVPRLLLAWVCTEAVRTQSGELVLGASLSEFMRKLGMQDDSGSPRGDRTRLRNQMDRLFHASVQLIYEDERGKASVSSFVADRTELWWDPRQPDERTLWESKIRLGEDFFQEIIRHPVPLDINILKALKRSSLGLDLYLWATYRTFSLKRPMRLSWPRLYRQFGADPAKADDKFTVRDFRKDCLRELIKIKTAWQGLNWGTAQIAAKISFKLLDQRTWVRSNRYCPYRMTLSHSMGLTWSSSAMSILPSSDLHPRTTREISLACQ